MKVYIIGSLANREGVFPVSERLRAEGHDVFDDWLSPGPEADDQWQSYERQRGRSYAEALDGTHARHIFEYDRKHLDEAQAVIMVLPAGKSGHLELGWAIGQGKRSIIYLPEEPTRYDLMYLFADRVVVDMDELVWALGGTREIGTAAEERAKNYPRIDAMNRNAAERNPEAVRAMNNERARKAGDEEMRGTIMMGRNNQAHHWGWLCPSHGCRPATKADLVASPTASFQAEGHLPPESTPETS